MAKTAYQLWKEDQDRKKQEAANGQVRFKEASQASRVQYTLPQYQGSSKDNNYKWETEQLKDYKAKGVKSYNDKFSHMTRKMGMSDAQANDFRRYLDFQEDRNQEYKLKKDGSPSNSTNIRAGQGAMLQSELMDNIFNNFANRQSASLDNRKKREAGLETQPKDIEELNFKDKIKNALGIDLSEEKQIMMQAERLGLDTKNKKQISADQWNVAKQKASEKAVNEVSKERSGLFGFMDRHAGIAGDYAHGRYFDINAENENYQQNAIEQLKKDPTDKTAIDALKMLNATSREPKTKSEKVAAFVGSAVGEIAPYTIGGAYGAADVIINKLGLSALKNPIVKDLARGGIAGTIAGTEKAGIRAVSTGERLTPEEYAKQIGIEAALAGGGDAAVGSVLRNLNLKGQLAKVYEGTGSKPFNQAEFQNALKAAFAPKGNVSNVLADPVKEMPNPFEPMFKGSSKGEQGPVVLKSINQDVTQLPKEELQKMYQQLADEHDLNLISGNEAAANVINEDLTNLEQLIKNGPPKQKTFNPSSIPSIETPPMLDDWFNYAQSGQGPTARGVVPRGNVSRGDRELIGNQADTILGRSDALKNAPEGGYNQRVLDVQQEMKTAMDKRGIYRQPLTPDELYQAVKGENDPATFDELIKLAELENNAANAPVNIKNLLRTDPKIAEAINKLNQLGGGPKKSIPPVVDQPNVQSLDEMLNFLSNKSTQKQIVPKEKTLSQAIEELNQKYQGLVSGKGKEEARALQKEFAKERDALYEQYSNQPLNQVQQLVNGGNPANPLEKLQQFLNTTKKTEQGSIPIEPNKIPATESAKPVNKVENIKPSDSDTADLIDTYAELEASLKDVKDIKTIQVGTLTPYEIADRLPKEMGEKVKNTFDAAKEKYVAQLEKETNELYENVVRKLSIKSGSKESAMVQDFGEKTLGKEVLQKNGIDPNKVTLEELDAANLQALKELTPKWENIVKADQYFRNTYDRLIEEVNAVRKQIYPNDPEKIVPKRNDYYHHFNELEGFEGFKNLFESPANISPELEGISPHLKPRTKWQGFMQKRGLGPYKSDAVGGFLKYVKAASHSINVDPIVPVLRNTKNDLVKAVGDSGHINKLIRAIEYTANDIAGKTNPYDRFGMEFLDRKGMGIVSWLNNRVKSNTILGNFGSLVGQAGSVPLGIGKAKLHAFPGLKNTLEQSVKELFHAEKNAPIYESLFLKERYSESLFRRFDQKLLQQPKRFAVWAMETADKANTRFIWNSMYAKGVKQGVEDAIKYADYETRKIVAGRGVAEVPLLQKSKTMQVFAPFTLEVGNQWKVMREMVGEKDAAGLITALVAAYGLNKAAEEVRGMNIAFDPIDAIIDGYTKNDGKTGQKLLNALGSLTGEVVGNIPAGNLLTQMVNTEKKVPGTDIKFKELFGERNPNRFGSGLTAGKVAQDYAYGLMPWGANQLRKTTRGVDALINGAVYKDDNSFIPFNGPKKELMYPENGSLWDKIKLPIMGPSSTSSARDYYENKRRPLNENQTNAFKLLEKEGLGNDLYDILRVQGTKPSDKSKITKISKDDNLSDAEKIDKLIQLMSSLKK